MLLSNGSTFDVIYGRDNNATPVQIRNVVNISTGYFIRRLNATINLTGYNLRAVSFKLLNGSDFDVVYGNQGTAGTGILNNTDQGKVYFNSSNGVFINGTLEVRTYTLRNGSAFNVIYGRDSNVTPAQLTAFVYNSTLAKITQVYNGTLLKTFNNSNRGKTYFNNTVFFNGTIQVRTYTLRNGSTFDVIYGARPDGNVTPIGITNIIYNGTGVKLVQVYNGTLLKTFNNSNRGKTYFNNTVFFNGTVEGRTFRLRNGTLFDVIYGRDTNNQTLAKNILLNNTKRGKIYLNTSTGIFVFANITSRGNLSFLGTSIGIDCTDIFGGTDSDFCADATGSGLSNNTFDLLTFGRINATRVTGDDLLYAKGALRVGSVNITAWAHVNLSSTLLNNTFSRLQYQRANFSNLSSKYIIVNNRTEPLANNSRWVGDVAKWFQRGFFQDLFIKRRCYTVDCSKYETYNGTHLVRLV